MTELDLAADVLHDWLQENGKCTEFANVDNMTGEGEFDEDFFFDTTENRGKNNRLFEDNTTATSSNRCPTLGHMHRHLQRSTCSDDNILLFNPELVSHNG